AYGIVQRRLERAVVDRTQELARRTRLIRLLGRIAEAAAAAETVGDMLRVGVDEISAFLRWPVGHAYHLPEGWPGRLVSTDTWKIRAPDTKAIASFRRASRDVPKRGKSIVGRALAARHALWVEDLADRNIAFIRRPAAARAGFKSGILLPVLAAGAPVAVLEFYTTAKTPVDAAVLSALNQIANHIGQVAERVAARAAQHRSEAVLAAVFANAVDPILVIDEKGIVQSANPAVERVFGFAPLDVIGRNVSMMMPPDVAQRHDGYLRRYLRTGEARVIGHGREITARRKSGETFPADLAVGEIDVGGRRLFAGTIRDLSERRSAEASLRTAQQQLADAIDHGGNSISLYDAGERLVIFNAEFRRVIEPFFGPDLKPGVRFEELARRLAAGGFYGGVRGEDWVQERCRAFRALEPMNLDKIEPDGTKQSGFVSYYRTRDGGTLVVNNDVTALREAEEKAQAVQRRFGEAIDGLADGIALYGPDERLVMCNRAYRDDLAFIGDVVKPGVSFEDVLRGLSDTQIYDGGGEDWIKSRLAAFRALKDTDVHFNSPQGRKWIRIRRFRASDGGTLLVRSDITAYRMAEEQAQAAQQQLVDAIEGIEDGIALYDRAEKLVMMNASYRRAVRTGESDPVAGETFEDLTRRLAAAGHYSKGTGEDVVRQRMAQFRALETVLISAQEPDGPHHLVVRHYRTRDGGTLIVRGDVTEQHRAEEQAMTAHQRLADAIEGISDGVALFDRDERLVLFNRP
ncbi:MAG: PAS-domain containing protein, partial [Pseudomonadota bacterium]